MLLALKAISQSSNSELPLSINTSGSIPHPSSILDVDSDSKGVLIPRLDQTEINAIPLPIEESLLIYNTSLNRYQYWEGVKFVDISPRESILDFDNDTKVTVEQNLDEDIIHFNIAGTEKMALLVNSNGRTLLKILDSGSNLHIGNEIGDNSSGSNNTYLGSKAGQDNSTGSSNVAIGSQALRDNTSYSNNVAIGFTSLSKNENNANTSVGSRAGSLNTTGQRNSFYGFKSGNNNASGSSNTYIGQESGLRNTSGSQNTYVGSLAGADGNGGSSNTYIGSSSGRMYSGSGNVFIGSNVGAGQIDPGSNKLMIDNSNTDAPLIYGDFQNDLVNINGELSLNNSYAFPPLDGIANQILQTDGLGNVSWVSPAVGGGSLWVNLGPNIFFPNGNVGIGNASPQAKLDIGGAIILSDNGLSGQEGMIRYSGSDLQGYAGGTWHSLTASGGGGVDTDWEIGDFGIHNTNDHVGIGVNAINDFELHVFSNSNSTAYFENESHYTTSGFNITSPPSYGLRVKNNTTTNAALPGPRYGVFSEIEDNQSGEPIAIHGRVHESNGKAISGVSTISTGYAGYFEGNVHTLNGNNILKNSTNSSAINIDPSGHQGASSVTIKDGDNDLTVEIYGQNFSNTGGWIGLNKQDGSKTIELDANTNEGGEIILFNENEVKRIEMVAKEGPVNNGAQILLWGSDGVSGSQSDAAIQLDADYGDGDSRIITDELEIRGGSDLAEHFDIVTAKTDVEIGVPQPGMIVSIDPNSTGKLILTSESYDKKVAGIISGAHGVKPGMLMGQDGTIADGDYPIALTGRVYVKASHEGGEIKPGDLLTSSSDLGIAMKVEDFEKGQGAIIGKAMTKIDEDGYVLVLVNLQ